MSYPITLAKNPPMASHLKWTTRPYVTCPEVIFLTSPSYSSSYSSSSGSLCHLPWPVLYSARISHALAMGLFICYSLCLEYSSSCSLIPHPVQLDSRLSGEVFSDYPFYDCTATFLLSPSIHFLFISLLCFSFLHGTYHLMCIFYTFFFLPCFCLSPCTGK